MNLSQNTKKSMETKTHGVRYVKPGRAAQYQMHVKSGRQLKKREKREKYYTYPALRLIQVLPGRPLAEPKR